MALADDGREISQPKNVTAVCGTSSANIAWEAVNQPGVVGYNVYSKVSPGGNYQIMNSVLIVGTTYVAGGLSGHTTYNFGVKTVFSDGFVSGMSDPATCTTS